MGVRTTRAMGVGALGAVLIGLVVLLVVQSRPHWTGFQDGVSAVAVEDDGRTLLVTYDYGLCADRTRVLALEDDDEVRLGTQTQGDRGDCTLLLLTGQKRIALDSPLAGRRVVSGQRVLRPAG